MGLWEISSQLFLRYGIEHYPDLNCKLTKKPRETMTFVREAAPRFDEAWLDVRDITMNIFAQENSHSVQNTI